MNASPDSQRTGSLISLSFHLQSSVPKLLEKIQTSSGYRSSARGCSGSVRSTSTRIAASKQWRISRENGSVRQSGPTLRRYGCVAGCKTTKVSTSQISTGSRPGPTPRDARRRSNSIFQMGFILSVSRTSPSASYLPMVRLTARLLPGHQHAS